MDISFELILVFAVFWMLTIWTLARRRERALTRQKNEWFLDVAGLLQQGFLFPLIQTYFLFIILQKFAPQLKGTLALPPVLSFVLQFIVIDYLYYWNHRLLHLPRLWHLHRIHHSSKKLDTWVSSRNSLWSSFFILYMWAHAFFIFALNDARSFILAIAVGNALDLWRHSGLRLPKKIESLLGTVMVIPHHHEWHHSNAVHDKNFGANFILWDKLHGTYYSNDKKCEQLGEAIEDQPLMDLWLFPWRIKKMTLLGKCISFFPLIHFTGFFYFLYLTFTSNPIFFAAALFWLYLLPLLLNRIHNIFYPLIEESKNLQSKEYSAWWGSHQLQYLFIVIPQFEHILHIIPGLYSLWLRAWGSKIGKRIYWTPRVEILDRGLVEIGHGVVIGHLTTMCSHMVIDIDGRPHLITKKIIIGDRSFIGADSQFGPGAVIEPKSKIKVKTRLWWRGEYL